MTPAKYIDLMEMACFDERHAKTEKDKALAFSGLTMLLDTMDHASRIALREALESQGYTKLLRTLFYDYSKQCWI